MTFRESDLQFDFSTVHWKVMKYDAHRYFKTLSGAGLKGVDFIGIYQQKQLVFFEIKHYRTYHSSQDTSFQIFEDTDLFVQNIKDKMDDTLTAISVILKYLNRKRWYRYFLKLEAYIPTRFIQKQDWYFWHKIHRLLTINLSKTFVLWLEIDPKYSAKAKPYFEEDLQIKLREAFKNANFQPILANRKKPVFQKDLNVKKGT